MSRSLKKYLPIIIIGIALYFLIIRPASKGFDNLFDTIKEAIDKVVKIPQNTAEYINPNQGLGYTLQGG